MNRVDKVAARGAVQERFRREAEMARARKLSGPQKNYLKTLIDQVGESEARTISKRVLAEPNGNPIDALAPVAGPHPWSRERRLDHLSSHDATILINALLDKAGRKGRRKNNR